MRFHALATDYDGTLAHDGKVDAPTLAALERLRATGRKLILVSGRELPELERTFSHLDLFDLAVLENGALLYRPSDEEQKTLAARPPESFVRELKRRGVNEVSVGKAIVATWRPYEATVRQTIHDLGLDLQVIANKDAVMVLPTGANKATGLLVALDRLGISHDRTVGVGDAENDQSFLAICACSVAVANALPEVKERVTWVTDAGHGAGVAQLIARLLDDDLASVMAGHRQE
jgi:HAD superfamily hydrolase (TIGR01484 family)